MGSKTAKSTQAITIPPEVLARYNAINARADTVTNRPFQRYTGEFVAPLTGTQRAGMAATNAAAGMAQPYFASATNQLMGAQQAASPYYQGATEQLAQGINAGNQFAGQSSQTLNNAQDVGSQFAGQSAQTLGAAQDVGNQFAGQSAQTLGAAQNQAGQIQQTALNNFGASYSGAQPYNEAAGGLYQQGLEQGRDFTGRSAYGTDRALAGAEPYQQAATQFMNTGAQAVNPGDLGADQINKYLSPYLGTVLQGTAGLLNQQNQQQQSGQMGNAIRSGAFGGDRGGIAAANLNQQQNLANSKIFSDILNQGFGQALGTAQQQQQLGLGAAQANRAAQQQASQQALAIGQQGFGQGLSAAQQQAALGQQLFGMGSTTGQNAAALGQQIYSQGMGAADRQAAMGQQVFGQGATAAAQQAALGQQQFGQGATAAAQQAALGQQQFGQGATTAAQQAALGQQQFGQGTAASQQAAALGQGIYGMGANTAAQTAALGTGAQDAALSGAAAQMTAGQVEQATNQAKNTAEYNQFLQEQSLPYQQLKLASDIALGTGTAQGSTTTTTQPGGFFSDERLKENIKAVGKTFDGQTIHSYNYKGDPRTQIGLIAQEVQKHHPDAVGLAAGYKTVNYDKATEDAADRGHMAYGGLASAGGSVLPQNAGQGFASGGLAGFDPATMQQLLAAQQAMYDPIMKGNMYAGGPNAGGGLVPQTEFTARQLMTAGDLPAASSGVDDVAKIASIGNTVGEVGDKFGAWDWDGKEDDKKTPVPTKAAPTKPAATGVAPPPPPVDTTPPTAEELSRSHRKQYADGGMPYSNQVPGMGLDIPTGGMGSTPQLMTASPLEKRQSGFSKLLGTAANAASIYGAVKKKASGGEVPYESNMSGKGLDIPEEDGSSNKYDLMTPASLEKPESGLDKVGKIAQIAGSVAAVASDKRMKENIKAIGKLFDGQIVHSFNYKGDPRTQIGLIAQEVEDHQPHAVGLAGGMKTVDYRKATSGAARRGHFAEGGMPEEEMDNIPSYEPTGLYHGDNKLIRNLFKATASGNKNIDLMSGEELPAGEAEAPQRSAPANMPEPAGLAAAAKEGLPELLEVKKLQTASKPAGLTPAASALPKNIMQIARLIHAGEGTGQNPMSSAKGAYQMIDSTFAGQFRKQYPDRARGMSDRDIIALKRSPEGAALSEAMGPKLIEGNARIIERGGFEPDAGNVYLAHFLGPDTAVKVLRANPNAPIANYVSEEAIMANPPLQKNPTVGGVIDWARGSMAKQAARLSRASGGLAGRDGYALDGAVDEDPDAVARQLFETPEAPVEQPAPTGLAPADKPAAPAAPATPAPAQAAPEDNNFFRGLARGKATSVIPFLTGIGALGTARTVSPGVAIAAGLGAGAQAAQGQRAFGIKQGELKVAQQLADARTMEITKGILEGRYQFLENGQVWDKYSDKFLPADQATIAKAKAYAKGPQSALTDTSPAGISRAQYLKDNPTAGTVVPQLPAKRSYRPNPSNPSETILAAAELNPGVMEARANRDRAEFVMQDLYKTLGAPGVGSERYTQLANNYALAKGDYERADAKWKDTIGKVVEVPMAALQGSNAAKIGLNASTVAPFIGPAAEAIDIKQNIRGLLENVGTGGPLSPITQAIGNGLIQLGVDKGLIDNLVRAPDSSQTQDALARQLGSYGGDPEAAAALKLYGTSGFSAAAVRAVLRHAENRADAKIAAFNEANNAFNNDPLTRNVAQAAIAGQAGSYKASNAAIYRSHPVKGALKAGTPYKVVGDPTLHYAK
jgi:hypothetical protein